MLRISGVGGVFYKRVVLLSASRTESIQSYMYTFHIYLFNIFRLCDGFEDIGLSVIQRPDQKPDPICQTTDEGYQTVELTV